ncbi:hypothetical protein C9374_011022 [Naegleria lovaniensis]|uniref:Uncharacterized protein n=1 Tax=Naegleria lovaniensis TaxID=51637 RepID=A0AA88GEV5_NAELO|nr:uncharacterized protein C9374_011022 [Naegleria lovaniensis]KAG2374185.1 hypothetical protein C9374_011022 [Naegleria lovaniensis]
MNKSQSKTGSVSSSSSPAMGERVFLFLWAFLSNTRDWIMEYTHDVFNAITQNYDEKTLKEMKERKRRKKAYLQRLKHQMGYFTPERKTKSQQGGPNSSPLEPLDSISKMEDLESQLMMLKEQIAMVARAEKQQQTNSNASSSLLGGGGSSSELSSRRKKTKSSSSSRNHNAAESAMMSSSNIPPPPPMSSSFVGTKTVCTSSNIPPPPPVMTSNIPPPPPIMMTPSKSFGVAKPIQTQSNDIVHSSSHDDEHDTASILTAKPKNSQPLKHSMSIADLIKNSGSVKLRPIQKSPGGTPMRKSTSNIQGELFAAIKNKFSSVHKLQKQDCEDESDVESSSSFTCSPVKQQQQPTKPLTSSSPMVKSQAKIASSTAVSYTTTTNDLLDKENLSPQTKFAMARRNIAKLFEK